jgi:uncharacterized membrane protein
LEQKITIYAQREYAFDLFFVPRQGWDEKSFMKKRYLFLDLLKALAVAEMIHGHSLDGLLDNVLRSSVFYVNWVQVRGYTAPVFLFAAGFAFALATLPRVDEYSKFSTTLFRRLRRLLFFFMLG